MPRRSVSPPSDLLELIEARLSNPARSTDVTAGYRQLTVAQGGQVCRAEFTELLAPYLPVWDAWVSWIEPGGYVAPHVDAGPYRERWQVPLTGGAPFQVEHWQPHQVCNTDETPRVHLVIDRDVIVDPSPARFRLIDGPAVLLP